MAWARQAAGLEGLSLTMANPTPLVSKRSWGVVPLLEQKGGPPSSQAWAEFCASPLRLDLWQILVHRRWLLLASISTQRWGPALNPRQPQLCRHVGCPLKVTSSGLLQGLAHAQLLNAQILLSTTLDGINDLGVQLQHRCPLAFFNISCNQSEGLLLAHKEGT